MELAEIIQQLRTFTVPELCDGAGLYHVMDARIKPQVGKDHIVGTAVTVDVPVGEGDIVSDAILKLHQGDVLVIAGKSNMASSYWGDHRSYCAKLMGAEAVVVDGAFRDVEGCEEIGFPVFAMGLTCGTALKCGQGAINVPVACGNVVVMPGDIICGDRNGVLVIHPEDAESIMEKVKVKQARQAKTVAKMQETGTVITKMLK